jgi:hypothetical protein
MPFSFTVNHIDFSGRDYQCGTPHVTARKVFDVFSGIDNIFL